MVQNVGVAQELGYIVAPPGVLLRPDEIAGVNDVPGRGIVLVTTGSQGEPTSALARMANRDHRQVQIAPGDTVIVSAAPIPGNEELVARTIDNLFRLVTKLYPDFEPHLDRAQASRWCGLRPMSADGAGSLRIWLLSGWNARGMNAWKPPVSSLCARTRSM